MPNLYIIAGCNGAGKTTASFTVLPEMLDCDEFINAEGNFIIHKVSGSEPTGDAEGGIPIKQGYIPDVDVGKIDKDLLPWHQLYLGLHSIFDRKK